MYYVEHFHWFSDSDQLSYILVTFRAAVEFLRGREMEKWLPSTPQVTKSQVWNYNNFVMFTILYGCHIALIQGITSLHQANPRQHGETECITQPFPVDQWERREL